MEIFDNTMSALEKGIYNTGRAQEVTAQNIANANNPNYVPLKFNELLNKAVEDREKRSVNIEEEMIALSENTGKNAALAKFFSAKLAIMRSIVTQGRK